MPWQVWGWGTPGEGKGHRPPGQKNNYALNLAHSTLRRQARIIRIQNSSHPEAEAHGDASNGSLVAPVLPAVAVALLLQLALLASFSKAQPKQVANEGQ